MSAGEFVVFYSWQSDLPNCTNRGFIEAAVRDALRRIDRSNEIEVSPRLDKDTDGVSGMPDIAATILDKIRGADCFVCDVSFIGATQHGEIGEKHLPNPNVMVELGYALAELGHERIVAVLNEATGGPDRLPFDLRNRRWPVMYCLKADADTEARSSQKVHLRQSIAKAIEAVAALPPRQKPEAIEGRVEAVEAAVAQLHGAISQFGLLNSLVSNLRDASAGRTRPEADGAARCAQALHALAERTVAGSFADLQPDRGLMVAAVCPDVQPEPLPVFDPERTKQLMSELRPIGCMGWDYRRSGTSFTTFATRAGAVRSATQIDTLGTVLAAAHIGQTADGNAGRYQVPETAVLVPSVGFEQELIGAVYRYARLLQLLGAAGPWWIGFGLVNIRDSALTVSTAFHEPGRLYGGEQIVPQPVLVPAAADLADPQVIARAMRPAFDYVWREYNFAQSANYNQAGDWVGR